MSRGLKIAMALGVVGVLLCGGTSVALVGVGGFVAYNQPSPVELDRPEPIRIEPPKAPVPAPSTRLTLTPPGAGTKIPTATMTASGPPVPDPVITQDQCDDVEDGGPVEDDCFTGTLTCNEMVIGHTKGGVNRFDSTFWDKKKCWPRTVNHDGGDERVYRLRLPEGPHNAWITVQSPCADLTVAAMSVSTMECPTLTDTTHLCEMKPKRGVGAERIQIRSDGKYQDWVVVVEGKGDDEGPFSLHVECAAGIR